MKKFFYGFLFGLLFVALAVGVLVYAATRLGGGGEPKVAANSTLVLPHLEAVICR